MPKKTRAEAEETRERLLDAAEQVFLEQGVSRTSLDAIAQRAGMTRGAVYWHFENKSALFNAMFDRVALPMVELLGELNDSGEDVPFARLRELCRFALRKLVCDARHRRVHTILFHRCEQVDEINAIMGRRDRLHRESLASMTRYFGNAAARGDLRSGVTPELAARAVHVYMTGLYSDWLRNPQAFDLSEQAEALLDIVLTGLRRG